MDESTVDAIAANFSVTRSHGGYASGGVTLYFDTAQTLTVPRGTLFATADGLEYATTANYTISSHVMTYNRDAFPLYNTAEIPLRSKGTGEDYNIEAGMITSNVTWGGTATKISNINPLVGGQRSETNTDIVERIRDSVHGPNMSSVTGITKLIKSFFPSTHHVEVVGTNHPSMSRDLSALTSLVADYQEEDFYMIYSGMTGPLAKQHRAY